LVFGVTDSDGNYYQFKNNEFSFKKFIKLLNRERHCVVEAKGYYHYQLAYHLLESSIKVSVENPLAVKRFIHMKLPKIKTDKSDSKLICEYAGQVDLKLWIGNSKTEMECLKIVRAFSLYTKQSSMLKNKLHGESVLGHLSKDVLRSLNGRLKQLQKVIKNLEDKFLSFGKTSTSRSVNLLKNDSRYWAQNSDNVSGFNCWF
jgi:transposase